MANSASANNSPDSAATQRNARARKRRSLGTTPHEPVKLARVAAPVQAAAAELKALPVKPLLIGVGIGAALVGTALAVRSKSERTESGAPFHGQSSALVGALGKAALFALSRVISGQTVRAVAARAVQEAAEAWKT